ncbi:unnamed protein product, partial [Rotaria magnacalcarata]
MIEGSKSATSICYSWFCAKKTERKRLRYEEQYRLLLRHKHNLFDKSLAYFRDPPIIQAEPPEHPELEIVGENRPPMHQNPISTGPGSYVPMSPMLGSMHSHQTSIPMQPPMVDMTGKQTSNHITGPPTRGPTPGRVRASTSAAAAGSTTKRQPRMPRSGSTRAAAIQASTPTAQAMYQPQASSAQHPMYPQTSYNQWMPTPNAPVPQPPPQQ